MTDIASPVPAPGSSAPPISRAIYGMPMFATLQAADLDATVSWYVDGLGFIVLFSLPGPHGPALVHLRRWQFQDLLLRPAAEPPRAGTGITLNFAAAHDEIDAVAEHARRHGGGRVDGPHDTAWNTREFTAVDPDGTAVVLTAPRPPGATDPEFTGRMMRWSAEQGLAPADATPPA